MIFDKCIICGNLIVKDTPPEHVIPQYLGGRLALPMLCEVCNHGIGARLYSSFKTDIYIRQAGHTYKDQLSEIHDNIEKRQRYTTTTPTGTKVSALRTNTGIHLRPGVQSDGSVVLPTVHAVSFLAHQMMREDKVSKQKAFARAESIWDVPNKELRRISSKHKIVRWDVAGYQKDFSENTVVDYRAPALMAYEYLALLLGKSIYSEAFNSVRSYIVTGNKSKNISVHNFISPKPQAFHLIYPEFFQDKTVIHIHIFEYAVYNVEIRNLRINNSPDAAYLEDLINKKSFRSLSVKDAKNNQWRELKI